MHMEVFSLDVPFSECLGLGSARSLVSLLSIGCQYLRIWVFRFVMLPSTKTVDVSVLFWALESFWFDAVVEVIECRVP